MVDRIGLYGQPSRESKKGRTTPAADGRRTQGASFDAFLRKELDGIRLFGPRREERLRNSRIELSREQMDRLNGAVSKAAAKGARELTHPHRRSRSCRQRQRIGR